MYELPITPQCVWPAQAELGEGPVWVEREQALYWVDIKGHQLHRHHHQTGAQHSWPLDAQLSALAPRAEGGFVAATRNGFALLEFNGDTPHLQLLGGPEQDLPSNRFNDGKADPQGRFWAGSMDDGECQATGSLYRLDTDLRWQVADTEYVITNGPTFSPDGHTLYHTDTLRRRIYAFDMDNNDQLQNKRLFLELKEGEGYPDGMTVDAEGCLWVCHWGGWCITRVSPSGERLARLKLPVANVTSCTFAGSKLDTLYITSARKGLNPPELERQPMAGGLFRCQPGVTGLETPLFLG